MYVLIVSLIITSYVLAGENDATCVTPNGETARCKHIWSCKVIRHAITYFKKDGEEFAKKSRCGNDSGSLVCCGSVGQFVNSSTLKEYSESITTSKINVNEALNDITEDISLPDSSLCGIQIPDDRLDSNLTDIGEYPWIAALKYVRSDDDSNASSFYCSGTLINQEYVLTAANCLSIPGYNLTAVRLGKSRFSETKDCFVDKEVETCVDTVVDLPVVNTIIHPDYKEKKSENNIALLHLERKVYYSDYIRPLCLPSSDFLAPEPGTLLDFTIWETDVKLPGQAPYQSQENCSKVLNSGKFDKFGEACAGGEGSVNACFADLGAPVIKAFPKTDENKEKQWYQEGIIYEKHGCKENETPFLIYIRLSNYTEWILNNLK
ncbi:hypothetical protein ILUMI_08433 [Ignelater luminosus]|uniref:CLIP domain-containing serine protease n=1 Tax=Ignelater luminosus TaxID=2038154 RepID=A0A8K0D1N0_IGNLU|nr:hypothetical protein ILUMI_08433 [Ignelater luminosus]